MTQPGSFDPQPVVLAGAVVRLEPIDPRHAPDLFEAGREPAQWLYMPRMAFRDAEDALEWVRGAQDEVKRGDAVIWALVDTANGRAVGSTRFLDIRRSHCGLEIGWTWIAAGHQRTALNTEAKLLLLRHAFDELGALRVQLKCDGRNERSQRAIERLGAVREGVLRRHQVCWDGFVRDTVYYSILDREWPSVRARLERFLHERSGR